MEEEQQPPSDWLRLIDANESTKAYKKLWAYFLEVYKTDYYQEKIKTLRQWFQIPSGGFKSREGLYPPEEWKLRDDNKVQQELNKEIKAICRKYSLHYADWGEVIEHDLFYNEPIQMAHLNSYNLVRLHDIVEEKEEPFGEDFTESDDFFYPIGIRFSPYATQRDLLDYIKKMWPLVKDFQSKYRQSNVKIGKIKIKKKSVQERNKFIYDNKDLPLKQIRSLLAKQNIFVDDGLIAKVISLEKRKRKEL